MRKRGNNRHRNPYSIQYWWHRVKQFWRSLVRSVRMFLTDDVDQHGTSPSPKSIANRSHDENFDNELIMPQPAIASPRPLPFLLGLDDLPDLDSLTTRELVDQIEWNAASKELVIAKEEDLSLLEDLLINFPDS